MADNATLLATGLFLHVRYAAAYGTLIDMSEFETVRHALAESPEADGRALLLYCCNELERIARSYDTDRTRFRRVQGQRYVKNTSLRYSRQAPRHSREV